MTHTPENTELPVSAVKIFKLIEKEIEKIDTYPLTTDNIIVQQDAYKRLGAEEEDYEVFASLEQGRKEKDTDLRFMAQFADEFFMLDIENIGSLVLSYEDLGKTDKEVAKQLVATLIMLSNGQLSCIHTARHGRLCAVETVYRSSPTATPATISIEGSYPRFVTKDNADDYDVHVLRNHSQIKPIAMPDHFFLRAQLADGSPLPIERSFEGKTITPLTKTMYKTIMNSVSNTLVGVEDDKQFMRKINGSWVLWLTFAIFSIPIFIWVPDNIFSYAAPLAGLAAFLAACFITGRYLVYMETLRLSKPDHALVKLDHLLQTRSFMSFLYQVSLVATLVSLSFSVYVTKSDHALTTLLQLSHTISPLVLLPGAAVILALILSFGRTVVAKISSAVLGILSIIGLCIVNFGMTYTGEDVSTPEPQTTIVILAYLAQLVLSIVMLVRLGRKTEAENHSSATHTSIVS